MRLLRESVDAVSVEVFKTRLDGALGNLPSTYLVACSPACHREFGSG